MPLKPQVLWYYIDMGLFALLDPASQEEMDDRYREAERRNQIRIDVRDTVSDLEKKIACDKLIQKPYQAVHRTSMFDLCQSFDGSQHQNLVSQSEVVTKSSEIKLFPSLDLNDTNSYKAFNLKRQIKPG